MQRDGRTVRVQAHPELVALITLGGLAERLFAAEADEQMGNNERNRLRQAAMRAYQEYTAEFGYLSRGDLVERPDPGGEPGETMLVREYNPVRRMFRQDPVWPTLLAVEVWDDDEQAGVPALILSRRVGARPARKEHTDDPAEALLLCLDRCGQVDLDVIAAILQVPAEDVPVLLGPAIWRDPADMCWVTADEYLSGNVRAKLAQALAAGEGWEGNAAALETVQPEDLGPEEINVQLGAPWMPPEIVERFVCHLLHISWESDWDGHVTCRYEPLTSTWEVRGNTKARQRLAATATWGTTRVNALNLVEDACNGTTPVVYDMIEDKQVRNREETALAAQKIRDLHEAFATWVWEDPGRADLLAGIYNRLYNNIKVRTFDGGFPDVPRPVRRVEPVPAPGRHGGQEPVHPHHPVRARGGSRQDIRGCGHCL